MKTLSGVQLGQPEKEVDIETLLDTLKRVARETVTDQDFIFVTGIYRIEFHSSSKIFVVEQRHFDHEPLEQDETTN